MYIFSKKTTTTQLIRAFSLMKNSSKVIERSIIWPLLWLRGGDSVEVVRVDSSELQDPQPTQYKTESRVSVKPSHFLCYAIQHISSKHKESNTKTLGIGKRIGFTAKWHLHPPLQAGHIARFSPPNTSQSQTWSKPRGTLTHSAASSTFGMDQRGTRRGAGRRGLRCPTDP